MPTPPLPEHPFTYAQLADVGLTRSQLRREVESGRVRRLLTNVYVAAAVTDSMDLRIEAAALAVRPDHIACDRTAAWLHGVDTRTFYEHAVPPAVEVCVLRGSGPTQRADVRGRSRDLRPADVVDHGPLRSTTPLRTALDLGCNLTRRDALGAIDCLRRVHGLGLAELEAELPRFRRRRGVVQLRGLVVVSDPRSESVRESWTRLALLDAGLPVPELQWWVEIDGVPVYRLDLAYPRHRVAIEYDGEEFHHTQEQRRRDLDRRDRLRDLGWTVIVVRNGDFSGVRLEAWVEEVRRALQDRPCNLRW
jgi:hypothetical protein